MSSSSQTLPVGSHLEPTQENVSSEGVTAREDKGGSDFEGKQHPSSWFSSRDDALLAAVRAWFEELYIRCKSSQEPATEGAS